MPLRRFVPATILGGFFWALIYATIGLAVFQAAALAAAGSPWGIAALALVLVAVVAGVVVHRRARLDRVAAAEAPVESTDQVTA